MDLVSIGHILKETILSKDGTRELVLGSPAAYSTVCAARLGAKVGIVSRIGKDMPANLLKSFNDAIVDQRGLDQNSPCTTTNELGYDSEGRKRILRYRKKAPPITLECIPEVYYNSRVFYVCGVDFEVQLEVIKKVASLGGLMACDLGGLGGTGRPLGSRPPMEENQASYRKMVSHFRILKVSDDDCILITGGDLDSVASFIDQILSWGPEIVLLTKGSTGTDVYTNSGIEHVPAFSGKAIDTTGGGDCFMAGFLVEYSRKQSLLDAVRFGSMVALFVIEKTGGVTTERMPTYQQVENRLRRQLASN